MSSSHTLGDFSRATLPGRFTWRASGACSLKFLQRRSSCLSSRSCIRPPLRRLGDSVSIAQRTLVIFSHLSVFVLGFPEKKHKISQMVVFRAPYHISDTQRRYWGPPPNRNDWTDSWEEWWGRQLHSDVVYTQEVYGKDQELADLTAVFIEKVVARLLRPLQTGGRSIKPSLCHGDLWDGNVKIDRDTGQIVLYDSCSFYGHAEGKDTRCFPVAYPSEFWTD